MVKNEVIVKKSSPKNLSADCRSTVGRLSVNCRPTVGQLSADRFFGELFFTITKNEANGGSRESRKFLMVGKKLT